MNARPIPATPPASLLAMVMAASGRVDPAEVAELDRLGAYDLIGVKRERLLELANMALLTMRISVNETRWLRLADRSRLLTLQQGVPDLSQRLLICSLAEAVIHADGEVTGGEQQIYGAMLHHWGLPSCTVKPAHVRGHRFPGTRRPHPGG